MKEKEVNPSIGVTPMQMDDIQEEWRECPREMELSKYEVSNLGRLRNKKTGRISQATPSKIDGYVKPSVYYDNGIHARISLHVLIARTFIPNPDEKPLVDHINRVRDDNRVENLRWATYSENALNKKKSHRSGRPVLQLDDSGGIIREWPSAAEAAEALGCRWIEIYNSANGVIKRKVAGYKWSYVNIELIEGEEWKKANLRRYCTTLFVSSEGRIIKDKKLHKGTLQNGYLKINLRDDYENYTSIGIHRIVCATFHGPAPEGKDVVNHINGNKLDNRASNLEWCSQSDNIQHAVTSGLYTTCKRVMSISNDGTITHYNSMSEAALDSGADIPNIRACCIGKRNITAGRQWRLVDI